MLTVDDMNDLQHQNNGFTDNGSFEQQEYNYDANRNLTSDLNKHINNIVYNFLNLPQKIVLITKDNNNEINYLYSATGNKLANLTTTNHAIVKATDYIGNFVFENKELKYILTAEGRIVPNRTGGYDYQYFLKDHLGSTRVVFDQDGDILQAENYYPFGMRMEGFNGYLNGDNPNKYLYNGKELQDNFGLDWYDYGARFYDASLGRWHTIDPISEWHFNFSNYHYCFNNPINYIDPLGMDTTSKSTVTPDDPDKPIPLFDLPEVEIKPKKDTDSNKNPDEGRGGYHFVIDADVGVNNDSRKGDGETRNISLLMDNLGPFYSKTWFSAQVIYLMYYISDKINNVFKPTSDKEIVETHTGVGVKTDGNGQPIGKYKNWILKERGTYGKTYVDPTGDSVLLIFKDTTFLLAPYSPTSKRKVVIDLK